MIARYDIIQGTPEWHQIRWGKIGGTRASQLFGKREALLVELVSEHVEEFEVDEDGFMSSDMIRGIELQSEAMRQLSEYSGVEFHPCGWLQSEEFTIAGMSPDGISADHTIGAEIKCPARKKHTKTIMEDQVPDDNVDQCVHFFTVNPELEKLYFCSFRPESIKPLFVKLLTRESKLNFGTKAKPVMDTIESQIKIAKMWLGEMENNVTKKIEQLKF